MAVSLFLTRTGNFVSAWTGTNINGPLGKHCLDRPTAPTATLFVSMAGFDVPGPSVRDPTTGYPVTVKKATVLRLDLSVAEGKLPVITGQTVIASGFAQRASKDSFMVGPDRPGIGPGRHALCFPMGSATKSSPYRMR